MIIWRLVDNFRSQFFQSLLHFSIQENERSTTHRFGNTTNLCNSFRFTTSTTAPVMRFIFRANFSPLYPPSTNIVLISERVSWLCFAISTAPSRSVTLAGVTSTACKSPFVSTAMCRLIPDTFLPHHSPFPSQIRYS